MSIPDGEADTHRFTDPESAIAFLHGLLQDPALTMDQCAGIIRVLREVEDAGARAARDPTIRINKTFHIEVPAWATHL
jgi:hypothetical protein